MHVYALALACLAHACHGWRLQTGGAQLRSFTAANPFRQSRSQALSMNMTDEQLVSGCDFDYKPLRDALAAGKLEEADQITRNGLIKLAGPTAVGRGYVYFTEVNSIPVEDMQTLDKLWMSYSRNKFGYSVQKKIWLGENEKWKEFFRKIDWVRGEDDKYVRWRPLEEGESEFIYNVTKAQRGHLPLTNTLRGTKLFEAIFAHPAFVNDTLNPKRV